MQMIQYIGVKRSLCMNSFLSTSERSYCVDAIDKNSIALKGGGGVLLSQPIVLFFFKANAILMCDFSRISPTVFGTDKTPRRGRVYSVSGKRAQLAVFSPVSPTDQTKRVEFKRNKQFRKPKNKVFCVTILSTVSSVPKCYYTVTSSARPTNVKNRTTYASLPVF